MKVKVFVERAINPQSLGDGSGLTKFDAELDEVTGVAWAGRYVDKRTKEGVTKVWELLGWGLHLASRTTLHDMDRMAARVGEQEAKARAVQAERVQEEARAAEKRAEKAKAEAKAKAEEAARLRGAA